ncbi:MAG: hypothetical protein COA73_17560 [Candidatus Hydrogenedentota bacterium]|nr:MAG: hypothetical protein COA73_17560 [Candidatus Hydrogenedentota bacterium]
MASEDVDTIYRVRSHAEKAVCAAFGRSKRNAIGYSQSLLKFYTKEIRIMRYTLVALLAVMMVGIAVPAFAQLQNVEVGGSIRIRGNYYSVDAPGMIGVDSDNYASNANVEQRTTVNVKADFADDVTAFIELDALNNWGDDFREDTLTGQANLGNSNSFFDRAPSSSSSANLTNVNLYQAYIETRETGGYPVTLRIGRQEIQFGSEWLVGNNDTAANFTGLSFDGITARYDADSWNATALWVKLAENRAIEQDIDNDLYGIYASYTGFEDIVVDAYWFYARLAGVGNDGLGRGISASFSPDTIELHTIGLRAAGTYGQFDFEVEAAYQTGKVFDGVSASGIAVRGLGASDVDFDAIGANVEVGYTFDSNYQPRVFIGAAYFEGPDDNDLGFNRLYSDWEYSEILGNTDLSNLLILRAGASAEVTEKVGVSGVVSWFQADEELGNNDDDIGWELGLYATYQYSEDLYFEVGYARFFSGDGIADGNLIGANGLSVVGGSGDDEDVDYVYIETGISF